MNKRCIYMRKIFQDITRGEYIPERGFPWTRLAHCVSRWVSLKRSYCRQRLFCWLWPWPLSSGHYLSSFRPSFPSSCLVWPSLGLQWAERTGECGVRSTDEKLGTITSARSPISFDLSLTRTEMSDLEGNFDVIILGTGLVESIAAA